MSARKELRTSEAAWRASNQRRAIHQSRPKLQLMKHWRVVALIIVAIVLLDLTAPQHNFEVCQSGTSNLCKD